MTTLPPTLAANVRERLQEYDSERIGPRIWAKDHTVWKPDPTEIADRLGWLTVPMAMLNEVGDLERVASDADSAGYKHVCLLGMGGSSLAPEVLYLCGDSELRTLDMRVLDTSDPAQIKAVEAAAGIDRTIFLVASKSGGTIETISQYLYFRAKFPDARRFMAITDPGSGLAGIAQDEHFLRAFLADPEIGGRYSALSHFGMVPAALVGADVEGILTAGVQMAEACGSRVSAEHNPGAWLGIVLGEAARMGRDKLTLVLPRELQSFGWWVEQLVAESTGKEGKGILPVEGEAPGPPEAFGDDRIFVAYGKAAWLDDLERAGHPVVRFPAFDSRSLGAEFYRWEFATAIACWVLGLNPFDQPNVEEAKAVTSRILAGETPEIATPPAPEVLETVQPGDYIAINAFITRDRANEKRLQTVRAALRDRYHVPVTVGYGPRFLHSTGQFHKGGPNTGVFLQVVGEDKVDMPIPGRDYTFSQLKQAQAHGDLASLLARARRAARLTLEQLAELTR